MKEIKFTYDKQEYTLAYTRNSIRRMERNGFVADDIATKPMTILPDLFAGAFLARHPGTSSKKIQEIYEALGDKSSLIAALTEMYNTTIEETLLGSKEKEGNVTWTANWQTETED